MDDWPTSDLPDALAAIEADTARCGFAMPSERRTGSLLRMLAASKPAGRFLELGTGTGLATAWLLDGMDGASRLTSIDIDRRVSAVAKRHLGRDRRLDLVVGDADQWLRQAGAASYDLIFADAMHGKYVMFDHAWRRLGQGGIYVADDMLPQANWPVGHQARVDGLLDLLDARADCAVTRLTWTTGLVIAVRTSEK